MGVQEEQGRRHRGEYSDEEYCDFLYGFPAEMVGLAGIPFCSRQTQYDYGYEGVFTQETHSSVFHCGDMATVQEDDREYHQRQVDDVDTSFDSYRGLVADVLPYGRTRLFLEGDGVPYIIDKEQGGPYENPGRHQLEEPAEVGSAQIEQEKRRVSERGEYASAVGHHGYEEEYGVYLVGPLLVDFQKGPYHKHSRSGSAHQGSQQVAYGEYPAVGHWGCGHVTLDHQASGDHVEGQEQGDEWEVVEDQLLEESMAQSAAYKDDGCGNGDCRRYKKLFTVAFPVLPRNERGTGYGEQHQNEGNEQPSGYLCNFFHYYFFLDLRPRSYSNFSDIGEDYRKF